MEEYEHEDLDKKLQMFYAIKVITKDGLEYEPESLFKSILVALDQHLKEHDYKYSIIRDREFYQSKLVLEGKVKHLHSPARKRDDTKGGKCTDKRRGRNTLDGKNSQSRSFFLVHSMG